jgi:hypothetical protein
MKTNYSPDGYPLTKHGVRDLDVGASAAHKYRPDCDVHSPEGERVEVATSGVSGQRCSRCGRVVL